MSTAIARLLGALSLCAALGLVGDVRAEAGTHDARRALSIARTTQSPFCPGKTLDACPSPSAAEWRGDIRQWVGEGASDQEIRRRLQARVPEVALDGHPLGSDSWWLPALAVVLASLVLGVWASRHLRAAPSRPADEDDGEGDDRLDAELRRLDG